MPTATETGIRVDASDKRAGLDYGSKKASEARKAAGLNNPESSRNGNNGQSSEKRRVKNQAEIEKRNRENEFIRAGNERVERQQKEIKEAVDGALKLVSERLGSQNLSESERARLNWVKNSVKNARDKADAQGRYLVEVKDGEKVTASRMEGVPIEVLTTEVDRAVDEAKNIVKYTKKVEELKAKAEASKLDGQEKKREWRRMLDELPEGNLKKRIIARAEQWKQQDEANGQKYDQAKMEEQLGEACFEAIKDHTEGQIELLKKMGGEKTREAERLAKIFHTLQGGSDRYFFQHYKKLSANLDAAEKQKQHAYTTREAHLISQDPAYREILRGDYKSKLPKGFEDMDKERQDYELAMVALDNRLLLKLPEKKELLPDIKEEYEQVPVIKPEGRWIPVDQARKPTILNQPGLRGSTDIIPKRPEATPPPLPPEYVKQFEKKDSQKLFLIDISEIAKRMAWTKAEERLRKEFDHEGGFFTRVVKNAWKGISENYKLIKYFEQAKKEIQDDNNLMRAISERVSGKPSTGGSPSVSGEYLGLLDKIVAEYKNDVVDTQRELGDSMNNNPEVQAQFAELLYRFRSDKWDGPEYNGLDKRAKVELFVKKNIAGDINEKKTAQWTTDKDRATEAKGMLYASNFYEILESVDANYKEQIDAAVKGVMEKNPEADVEAVRKAISEQVKGVQGLNLQLGLRDRDLVNNKPKGILNFYERAARFGENHRVLNKILLNPFVIGAATAAGSRGIQRTLKWGAVGAAAALGASGFWVPVGIGVAFGGAYRAMKRSKDVKYDIAQELRQETLGGEGSEILDKKGGLRYEGAVMAFKDALGQVAAMKDKPNLSPEEKQQLAKIYARLQLERESLKSANDYAHVDLFSMDKDKGNSFGTTAGEKSDLRVALKGLSVTENQIQDLIDAEKTAISDIIKNINKTQEGFRRSEMRKSFLSGAIMGVAGALVMHELGEGIKEAKHLISEAYAKNHKVDLAAITHNSRGAGPSGTPSVERLVQTSRDRSAAEYLAALKGHVHGGEVQAIHTKNWYDNPGHFEGDPRVYHPETGVHEHKLNELRFYINKDSSNNFHFKVPIKDGDSWLSHPDWKQADIDKAFADGHIKMIFVPDGASPHQGIVLDIDPATKEIVVPPGSNIRDLFDPTTGRPKGTGFFGLAEQTGTRPDGSHDYIWINSEKGNGSTDFGKIVEQAPAQNSSLPNPPNYSIDHTPANSAPENNDSNAFPTVPLTRKVWLRPEEKAARKEKAKKKAENEAAERAKKDKVKTSSGSSRGESGGGGGGAANLESTKKVEQAKEPEFKGDMLKRYLNPAYAEELLREYESHTGTLAKIDKKAIKFAIEGDKNKGKFVSKPLKAEQAKAVWELEQALVIGKVIRQEQADALYAELQPAEKTETKADKEKPKEDNKDKATTVKKADIEKDSKKPEAKKMDAEVKAVIDTILEKYPLVKKIEFKEEDGEGFTVQQQKNRVDTVLRTLKMLDLEGKKGKAFDIIFSTEHDQITSYKENKIIIPVDNGRIAVQRLLEGVFKKSDRLESKAKKAKADKGA